MTGTHQSRFHTHFHARWRHLHDPHVRTLAWLLDAPGLLDAAAPEWQGRVAELGPPDDETADWLVALDRDSAPLHASLAIHPQTRLGRYAENLMAWYLRAQGRLVAQNVQVRGANNETAGEFDFLLREGDALVHWEFATKLYLLETSGTDHLADYFVGPNLADTLGAKIRKIMERQLALSRHPNAMAVLPQPVTRAQALVKGWLFYHGSTPVASAPPGFQQAHCRGFWCTQGEFGADHRADETTRYAILSRLSWLAPIRLEAGQGVDIATLFALLNAHLAIDSAPVLIALLALQDGLLLEFDRGFVVPDDWRERARRRLTVEGLR